MKADELLKEIDNFKTTTARNSMGCSENWYDPVYAIGQTFTREEISQMSEETIDALMKLGDRMSEAFY